MTKLPRGIRNNNPGNIRRSADQWVGLKPRQDDPDFCQFTAPSDGIRALMKILLAYYRRHNLVTVRQLIGRWAPPNENQTDAYVAAVCDSLGVLADSALKVDSVGVLVGLARAIVRHENGRPPGLPWDLNWWYGTDLYAAAAKRALV